MQQPRARRSGAALDEGDGLLSFEAGKDGDLAAIGGTGAEEERRFAAARRMSETDLGGHRASLGAVLREPMFLTLLDKQLVLAALPGLLPGDTALHATAYDIVPAVRAAGGTATARTLPLAPLFGTDPDAKPAPLALAAAPEADPQRARRRAAAEGEG